MAPRIRVDLRLGGVMGVFFTRRREIGEVQDVFSVHTEGDFTAVVD